MALVNGWVGIFFFILSIPFLCIKMITFFPGFLCFAVDKAFVEKIG